MDFSALEKGEFITYIEGRAGTLIDQITFHTSLRRTFGPFGGSGGQDFEISIPSNAKVIGFTGKAGPSIKQIGLICLAVNENNKGSQSPIIQTAPIPPATGFFPNRKKKLKDQTSILTQLAGQCIL